MVWSPHRRPLPAKAKPPARQPASVGMLIDEGLNDREFGSHGAMLEKPEPTEPAPAPTSLAIPPPDWSSELEDAGPPLDDGTRAPDDALAELKSLAGEAFDPPAPGPPVVTPPLTRPRIPEVDWNAEARERETHARLVRQIDEEGT